MKRMLTLAVAATSMACRAMRVTDKSFSDDTRLMLQTVSSGFTGCAPEKTSISELSGRMGLEIAWLATCSAGAFRCSKDWPGSISCSRAVP